MNLSEALSFIKRSLNQKEFTESTHFKEECKDKDLSVEEISKLITENTILGIAQQDQNLYKVWFNYVDNKDLIVIVRILPEQWLRLITLYPCNAERRKREHVSKS